MYGNDTVIYLHLLKCLEHTLTHNRYLVNVGGMNELKKIK